VIPFRDLISCDYASYEDVLDQACEWRYVFMVYTEDRPFRLYAQTAKERDIWVALIRKIIAKKNFVDVAHEQ
jgi:hypothetical protein